MDLQLAGKRALVTGSSVGIGEAIAHALASEGASVAVHGRDRERAERVAAAIIDSGGRAVVVTGDLTDYAATDALAASAFGQLGTVDILVNNAGGSGAKQRWDDTGSEAWADAYDRNVLAAVRLIRCVLPGMRSQQWGRIVNVSSVAGSLPPASGPDYAASKAAMNNLTCSLAKATASDNITVNAVSPGTVFTPKLEAAFRELAGANGWADRDADWAEVERNVLPHVAAVPVGRVGTASDVANCIAFLCSPLAGYVTGVNLRVDGGMMASL